MRDIRGKSCREFNPAYRILWTILYNGIANYRIKQFTILRNTWIHNWWMWKIFGFSTIN